jgi:hypothetical protein
MDVHKSGYTRTVTITEPLNALTTNLTSPQYNGNNVLHVKTEIMAQLTYTTSAGGTSTI